MNLLLSTTSIGFDAQLDPRFGRCAYFLVVDPDTMEIQNLANPALTSSGGAGVQAAQVATQHQCGVVISGDFGPNAYDALAAAGIELYKYGSCTSVQDVLDRYSSGQLEKVFAPGHAGHHGR